MYRAIHISCYIVLGIGNCKVPTVEGSNLVRQRNKEMYQTINFAFNQYNPSDLKSSITELYPSTSNQQFGSAKYDSFPLNKSKAGVNLLSTTDHGNKTNTQDEYLRIISPNADQKCFNSHFLTDNPITAQSQSFDIFSNDRATPTRGTSTGSNYSPLGNIDMLGIGNGSFGILNRSSSGFAGLSSDNFYKFRKNKNQTHNRSGELKGLVSTQEKNSVRSQNAEEIRSSELLGISHPVHESILESYPRTGFVQRPLPKQPHTTEEIIYAMHRNNILNKDSHPNIYRDGVILKAISKDMPYLYANNGNPTSNELHQEGKSSKDGIYLRTDKPKGKSLKRLNNPDWCNENDIWKNTKVAKIDEIFDIFVPAMGATSINESFIIKLINLHRNKSNETKEVKTLCPTMKGGTASSILAGGTKNAYSTLNKEDVLVHFLSLEESFIKFACSNKTFKELCVGDRTELLKRNSILFVMVSNNNFPIILQSI